MFPPVKFSCKHPHSSSLTCIKLLQTTAALQSYFAKLLYPTTLWKCQQCCCRAGGGGCSREVKGAAKKFIRVLHCQKLPPTNSSERLCCVSLQVGAQDDVSEAPLPDRIPCWYRVGSCPQHYWCYLIICLYTSPIHIHLILSVYTSTDRKPFSQYLAQWSAQFWLLCTLTQRH